MWAHEIKRVKNTWNQAQESLLIEQVYELNNIKHVKNARIPAQASRLCLMIVISFILSALAAEKDLENRGLSL
jgi:hypothetical protein